MNKGMPTDIKVGIFTLAVLLILLWITFRISSGSIFGRTEGYELKAEFHNAQGINTKTGVFLAGIKIGYVDDIKLKDDKALITLRIEPGVKIEENAQAIIRTKGLLGERYIEIVPGKQTAEPLRPGGTIYFTESPPDFEEVLNKLNNIAFNLESVTHSLKDVFGGNNGEKNLQEIVDNLNKTLAHMNHLVVTTDKNLNRTLVSLNTFTDNLRDQGPDILSNLKLVSGDLHEIIAKNKGNVNTLIDRISKASEKLDKTLGNLEVITQDVREGKGAIGKLLTDKKTAEQVSHAIRGINNMVGGTSRFQTIIDYRGEYQFQFKNFKSYLNLRLQPTPDKYFLLGIVDDPAGYVSKSTNYTYTQVNNGPVQQTQTVTQNVTSQLKLNAEIAKRISYFTFRGGIIESTGGVGIDIHTPYEPAWLSLEMYNFNSNQHPTLKAMMSISILRYFILSGGMTDIANKDSRTWFLGLGLSFNDEDLKNIFGLAASTTYVNTK
ncbi:MAG: MCE family protein [Deltaproteobacteria bacterium]|nr:MCE family protein [Deltaproteobacteria bacterium]MCL5792120.1 MCE family protein [Deltaproteobacteria bacterium]